MLDLLFTELPLQLYELRYCKQYESSSRSMTRIVKQLENRQINGLYDSRSPTVSSGNTLREIASQDRDRTWERAGGGRELLESREREYGVVSDLY